MTREIVSAAFVRVYLVRFDPRTATSFSMEKGIRNSFDLNETMFLESLSSLIKPNLSQILIAFFAIKYKLANWL